MTFIRRYITPFLIILLAIFLPKFNLPFIQNSENVHYVMRKISSILFIIAITWTIIVLLRVFKKNYLENYDLNQEDNLQARKLYTQFNILERIIIFVIITIAIGSGLMLFEGVRKFGLSVFASAGIAGIILGFAAQKALATILAGMQIAISQPIRLDDVLVVEGEWGWVEEITLTFVVVRIWDKRRLVLPTTYFIEKPFQNWTRTTAEILGTVFIYTDYNIDFDALRKELTRLLENTPLWDQKVNVLQVTDSKEFSVEIRALMSAKNSPEAWDLRVYVREGLIKFIQQNFPNSLPRTRVSILNDFDKKTEIKQS
ncbi:mechanosensitive ion channel family protein [Mangrovimonas sp. DI 80]|uniref:mechanosensitive ion channel family protein n=1 Tax=Mangrovimonas sp. DI 80 TaxID=1779330 RepID=UPI0009774972|nr:mechanosensitive ion channel domain-containing protein [Mangrovimonas sp. DI 80]OMP29924.1 mechanosensitive ion channel protein MscS [Mangrovimonas sp. DI 80]